MKTALQVLVAVAVWAAWVWAVTSGYMESRAAGWTLAVVAVVCIAVGQPWRKA